MALLSHFSRVLVAQVEPRGFSSFIFLSFLSATQLRASFLSRCIAPRPSLRPCFRFVSNFRALPPPPLKPIMSDYILIRLSDRFMWPTGQSTFEIRNAPYIRVFLHVATANGDAANKRIFVARAVLSAPLPVTPTDCDYTANLFACVRLNTRRTLRTYYIPIPLIRG
jgi:hypothetical protein